MTKKHFIALASKIKINNQNRRNARFNIEHLEVLADFLQTTNPKFKKDKWIDAALGVKK